MLILAFLPGHSFGFAFTTIDGNGDPQFNQTTGTPVKWGNPLVGQLVGFGFFPTGFVPMNGSASWDANALQTLQEWTQVSGSNFQFTGVLQSGDICNLGNHEVSSGWAADNCGMAFGDAVALTRILYRITGTTAVIVDADVLINSTLSWNVYDGPIKVDGAGKTILDFRRIVLHEYGHVLGLAHPDIAGQIVVAVMNSTFSPGSDTDRLTADDNNGAITLYTDTQASGGGGGGSSAFDVGLITMILLMLVLRTRCRRRVRK